MAYGKVVGGAYIDRDVDINRKGDLAIEGPRKKSPTLTAHSVASWQEITFEKRLGTVTRVSSAVARATLPGFTGKAASAAVESTFDKNKKHVVRVDWVGGTQSVIELPDELFQHLLALLKDRQIPTDTPAATEPEPPSAGMIGHLTTLAGTVRGPGPDVADQIAKLAILRDQGALTAEEFAAKKAQLLGLTAAEAQSATASAPRPGPLPPASPPAWAPDPHRRYQLRYWNGTTWTEHVSSGGVQTTDHV